MKVVIADDHRIVRESLRALLDGQPDVVVVAEATDGHEVVELVRQHHPDVVLMDVTMPGIDGIEATRRILEEYPLTRVIALSMHRTDRIVSAMFAAGAVGYVPKDCAGSELALAVRRVSEGRVYTGSSLGDTRSRIPHVACPADRAGEPSLTHRERQVLRRVARGMSSREIAEELGLSLKTVETHRGNIAAKLGTSSVADQTRYAIAEGYVDLDVS